MNNQMPYEENQHSVPIGDPLRDAISFATEAAHQVLNSAQGFFNRFGNGQHGTATYSTRTEQLDLIQDWLAKNCQPEMRLISFEVVESITDLVDIAWNQERKHCKETCKSEDEYQASLFGQLVCIREWIDGVKRPFADWLEDDSTVD